MTTMREQIELQEQQGYVLIEELDHTAVLKNEKGQFIKVLDDGRVIPIRAIYE